MRATELVVPVHPPLGATFLVPEGARAAALIIQGSGTHDRDGNMLATGFKSTLYRRVARELAERCGIASLRYDKRGHEKGPGHVQDYTVPQRLADATAALSLLRKLTPGLSHFLVGHSEGARMAGKLAESEPVAGVVSLAAPFGNLFELYQFRARRKLQLTPGARAANAVEFGAKLEALFKEGAQLSPEQFADFARPYLGAGYDGWESYDWLAAHWAAALEANPNVPMLVVQGGRDARLWPDNIERWRGWCKDRKEAEFVVIDHMGHDLNDARLKAFRVDDVVLETACAWIKNISARPQVRSSLV